MEKSGGGKKKKKKKKKIPCGIHVQSGHLSSWFVYFDNIEWTRVLSVGASCVTAAVTLTTVRPLASQRAVVRMPFIYLFIYLFFCLWGGGKKKWEVWEIKKNMVCFVS